MKTLNYLTLVLVLVLGGFVVYEHKQTTTTISSLVSFSQVATENLDETVKVLKNEIVPKVLKLETDMRNQQNSMAVIGTTVIKHHEKTVREVADDLAKRAKQAQPEASNKTQE